MGTSSTLQDEKYILLRVRPSYFLVALLDRAAAIKVHFESGKVRENWVELPSKNPTVGMELS